MVDALIDKAIAANDRQSLYNACRALDRVLRARALLGRRLVQAVALDRLSGTCSAARPPSRSYARGIPETWWIDAEKAAKLGG